MFPGVDDLVYSIKEDEAVEVDQPHLRHVPRRCPTTSREGLTVAQAASATRGPPLGSRSSTRTGEFLRSPGCPPRRKRVTRRVARRVLFDEAAHQEYAREIWKAIVPTVADGGGYVGAVSTANGMSDGQGGGNFFHEVYTGAGGVDYPQVKTRFLKWDFHPERDLALVRERPPRRERQGRAVPARRGRGLPHVGPSVLHDGRDPPLRQRSARRPQVPLRVLRPAQLHHGPTEVAATGLPDRGLPRAHARDGRYAIGVDNSTGSGLDYSVAAVIDLEDGAPCAEMRMRAEYREQVRQLHYLGRWYNTALIAPEKGGGYGDVIIAYLRDGHEGRPPYPRVYRHRRYDDPSRKFGDNLGFPMHERTRAKVISELVGVVRREALPLGHAPLPGRGADVRSRGYPTLAAGRRRLQRRRDHGLGDRARDVLPVRRAPLRHPQGDLPQAQDPR